MTESPQTLNLSDYSHSPAHLFVLLNDLKSLAHLLSSLPKLSPPSAIQSLSDAAAQTLIADEISAAVDRRDVPGRDTPLHLAVRLSSLPAASALLLSGADPSLQNSSGWTPLQESLSLRRPRRLSLLLLRHHRLSAFAKFRRRLPSLLRALSLIPDFYLELAFHFESSLIPFLSKAAPSDTYRIWKRGADLRADTTLAGFDGLRVRRADQSFIFSASSSSLLVLNRGKREVRDAFEGLDSLDEEMDEKELIEDASAYRPGLDVTSAEIVRVLNWRRKEMVKNLRPTVWLTEDFPLKTEELLPMLDILANKVKAVRRLREVLTSKFPPGTFPVKMSIPIVPTVRVVVTFTKFVDLQPAEQFFTPLSSPRHLSVLEEEEQRRAEIGVHKNSWLKWASGSTKSSLARSKSISPSQVVNHVDPFSVPSDYTWIGIKDRSQRMRKSNKGKQKETG